MSSESSSVMSTPEIPSRTKCFSYDYKIKNEIFSNHYNKCKENYLKTEKSKYYPLKEPDNINELLDTISNYEMSSYRVLNEINENFTKLHKEMTLLYSEENKKSMTPKEFFKIHHEKFIRRYSYNLENSRINFFYYLQKIKSTALELKNIIKKEIENSRRFSINFN